MNTLTSTPISNTADVIDSRDVTARIAYLEGHWDGEEERAELAALHALEDEAEGIPDWDYGEMLIHDAYFEAYAQELAEEIGALPTERTWPTYCIDWEWAARELRHDYISVDFDGATYWVRG